MTKPRRQKAAKAAPQPGYLAPPRHIREEFARRLKDAMAAKGLNQAELARRATDRLPKGSPGNITRDLISNYARAQHVPRRHYLEAIAKALGVEPDTLLPIGAQPMSTAPATESGPPVATEQLEEGRMRVRLNVVLSWEAALQVLQIVNEDTKKE